MRYKTVSALVLICASSLVSAQETPEASCGKILQYYSDGDVEGALEEARWCVQALELASQQQDSAFFRTEIGGWQRTSLSQNNALGFAVTEAGYAKEDKILTASLMGAAGGANSLGGLFGAIAQAGIAAAGTRMRIQQHAAVATNDAGNAQLMITLESGGQLQIASSSASLEEVIAFAEQFPITELDESR